MEREIDVESIDEVNLNLDGDAELTIAESSHERMWKVLSKYGCTAEMKIISLLVGSVWC